VDHAYILGQSKEVNICGELKKRKVLGNLLIEHRIHHQKGTSLNSRSQFREPRRNELCLARAPKLTIIKATLEYAKWFKKKSPQSCEMPSVGRVPRRVIII